MAELQTFSFWYGTVHCIGCHGIAGSPHVTSDHAAVETQNDGSAMMLRFLPCFGGCVTSCSSGVSPESSICSPVWVDTNTAVAYYCHWLIGIHPSFMSSLCSSLSVCCWYVALSFIVGASHHHSLLVHCILLVVWVLHQYIMSSLLPSIASSVVCIVLNRH